MARQWLTRDAEDRVPALDTGGGEAVQRSKVHVLRWERRGEPVRPLSAQREGLGASQTFSVPG